MAITKVDLANVVTGVLPVANGGTGTSTGVAPGGSTTQVQYNNAGAFAGSANLTFNGSSLSVSTVTVGPGSGNIATNTVVGNTALPLNSTGIQNVAVGANALANANASRNVAVGYQSLKNTTTGGFNTTVGWSAGYSTTTGTYNTFIGSEAGYSFTSGDGNTYIGSLAGYDMTGQKNTVVGRFSGSYAPVDLTTASGYVVISDGWGTPWQVINPNGAISFGTMNTGTTGQVLTSQGSGASPVWATPTVSGTAKAWVNFNGSGGGIRASSNVSSISVNGTGRYTVNMSTAQTDANYARIITASGLSSDGNGVCSNTDVVSGNSVTATTTAFGILLTISGQSGYRDSPYVSAAVFR